MAISYQLIDTGLGEGLKEHAKRNQLCVPTLSVGNWSYLGTYIVV
jgi:hypothetical protein